MPYDLACLLFLLGATLIAMSAGGLLVWVSKRQDIALLCSRCKYLKEQLDAIKAKRPRRCIWCGRFAAKDAYACARCPRDHALPRLWRRTRSTIANA